MTKLTFQNHVKKNAFTESFLLEMRLFYWGSSRSVQIGSMLLVYAPKFITQVYSNAKIFIFNKLFRYGF